MLGGRGLAVTIDLRSRSPVPCRGCDCAARPERVNFRGVGSSVIQSLRNSAVRFTAAAVVALLGVSLSGLGVAPAVGADAQQAGPLGSAADTPARETLTQEEAYAEFKRLFDAGEHAAAVERARTVVELAERARPPDEEQLQAALMNLGLAERLAGDYLAAEQTYRRVIERIEDSGRLASPRRARAEAGLALTYSDARRYDLAVPAFERAIGLNRRAEGLFNEEQLPLLGKQADALSELGRYEDALQSHRYALRLVARRYGERSLRYAGELEALGRWYTRARAYEASRVTLKRAAELVTELEGPGSLQLVGPLTASAENARRWLLDPAARADAADAEEQQQRMMYHDPVLPGPPSLTSSTVESEGVRALERAVAIVDGNPEAAADTVAAVHTQAGDWMQVRESPERALPYYQKAWAAAARAPRQGRALTETLFGEPVLLWWVAPDGWDRYAQRPPEEAELRKAEIELTVTPQGRARDARVTDDVGEARLAARALRSAEGARYRPRMADGQPVDTPGVKFFQPFYVLKEGAPGGPPAPAGGSPDAPGAPSPPAPTAPVLPAPDPAATGSPPPAATPAATVPPPGQGGG